MSCINDQNKHIITDFVESYWHITIFSSRSTRIRNRFSVATFGPKLQDPEEFYRVSRNYSALVFCFYEYLENSISRPLSMGFRLFSSQMIILGNYTEFIHTSLERDNFSLNNCINLIQLRQMVYEKKINIRFWNRRVRSQPAVCRFFAVRITSKTGLRF